MQRRVHARLLQVHPPILRRGQQNITWPGQGLMRTHMVLERNEPDCLHFCKHKPTGASARQKPTETLRSLLYPDKFSFALPRYTENRCNRQGPGKNIWGRGR